MQSRLDRNNTNFNIQLFEHFKNTKWGSEYSFLKYYQNVVREYINMQAKMASPRPRGLLIAHSMGLGKSILGVSIAIDLMKERQPILLLTKSLQENMRGAIKKYIRMRTAVEPDFYLGALPNDDLDAWISRNFSFVSMNASNMLKQMQKATEGHTTDELDAILEKKFGEMLKLGSLNGKLLIIDEAHNFFRAITNGSKNALGLYDMIMRAKDLIVIFLTGTPIASDPFELVPCFNMLAGGKTPLLPENYRDFTAYFVDTARGMIKNKSLFQNRILGLVSHVSHLSTPGKAFGIDDSTTKVEFPEELPAIIERVHMDQDQYVMYQLARDKEMSEGMNVRFNPKKPSSYIPNVPAVTIPKSKAASTYRVRSRQLSNFSPPPELAKSNVSEIPVQSLASAKFRAISANIDKHRGQTGIVYSQFVGLGGLGTFARYLETLGWKRYISDETATTKNKQSKQDRQFADTNEINLDKIAISDVDELSDKIGGWFGPGLPSVDEVLGHKYIIGSARGSINITNETNETNEITGGDDNDMSILSSLRPRTFAIISGEVDIETRTQIQELFNSVDNIHGGIIDLILISSTGAEGLDLKNGRHVHIMEMYWNWGRIAQIIARLVRNDSHIALSLSERNVQPYIYLAIPPEYAKNPDGTYPDTTDVELYNDALTTQLIVDSFNEAINEVSIECMINGDICRSCNPTNSRLFTDDIDRDLRSPDPCTTYKEQKIIATEITVDGTIYFYIPCKLSIYDYKIYMYDSIVNGYRPLSETDSRFEHVINAIKEQAADKQ